MIPTQDSASARLGRRRALAARLGTPERELRAVLDDATWGGLRPTALGLGVVLGVFGFIRLFFVSSSMRPSPLVSPLALTGAGALLVIAYLLGRARPRPRAAQAIAAGLMLGLAGVNLMQIWGAQSILPTLYTCLILVSSAALILASSWLFLVWGIIWAGWLVITLGIPSGELRIQSIAGMAIATTVGYLFYYQRVASIRHIVRAQQELRKLSRAVEQSPATIVITNLDGAIEYVNPRFIQTTGYTSAEALGQNPRILKAEHTSAQEYKLLWDTIRSGGEWRGEFQNKKKNGDLYWEAATIAPIWNERGEITHFLAVKEDITERKRTQQQLLALQDQLREQAIRDPLTHLFNRRYLTEMLPREIARAVRQNQPLALLMMDADHFKNINDTYGHAVGDETLQTLARLIVPQLRASDIVCRYGGEEILCVLSDTTQDDAVQRAEQLCAHIAQTAVAPSNAAVRLTLSIGVAMFPAHGANIEDLLKAADVALYRAKQDGRNCVRTATK